MYAEVTSIHVSQMTSFNMLVWLVAEVLPHQNVHKAQHQRVVLLPVSNVSKGQDIDTGGRHLFLFL